MRFVSGASCGSRRRRRSKAMSDESYRDQVLTVLTEHRVALNPLLTATLIALLRNAEARGLERAAQHLDAYAATIREANSYAASWVARVVNDEATKIRELKETI